MANLLSGWRNAVRVGRRGQVERPTSNAEGTRTAQERRHAAATKLALASQRDWIAAEFAGSLSTGSLREWR